MANTGNFSENSFKKLARSISLAENEAAGYEDLLLQMPPSSSKIIGITGAPGTGKSSLVDALIGEMTRDGKRVGVLCVDPSSPFNAGALLGDRIRMNRWYNHPEVFIRSLASKGSMGGLHPKIIEISDLVKSAGFDYVLIETVGVGQSEVDIAALADITLVLLVPEGGDAVQAMKAGLMEVADIFVINKYDRPGAEAFFNTLRRMTGPGFHTSGRVPIIKTIASTGEGIAELYQKIRTWDTRDPGAQKQQLLIEKMWILLQNRAMKEFDREELKREVTRAMDQPGFNLYRLAKDYFEKKYGRGRD